MIALMYHDVVATDEADASGFPGRDAALYKVTPDLFEKHLEAVRRLFFTGGRGENDVPVFTFDDGGASAMVAADVLERYGFVGHFFMTTNYIGTRGFLGDGALRALRGRGHVIGSHSCSHPLRIGHCAWPQLLDEWTRSRSILTDILGEDVQVASMPGGDFAPQVAEAAAKAGFTRLFTSEPTREARHLHWHP